MKTLEEIKKRVKEDFEDVGEQIMIQMCNGVHPLMVFHPDFYKDEYKNEVISLTEENIIREMQNYINFAIEKARNQRGLSANRSIWKFQKWLWTLEDKEITDFDFNDYGMDILLRIAKKYNLVLNG